jgi:hypothetical protein
MKFEINSSRVERRRDALAKMIPFGATTIAEELFEIAIRYEIASRVLRQTSQELERQRSCLDLTALDYARREDNAAAFWFEKAEKQAHEMLWKYDHFHGLGGARLTSDWHGLVGEILSLPEGQYLEYLVGREGLEPGVDRWRQWRSGGEPLPGWSGSAP